MPTPNEHQFVDMPFPRGIDLQRGYGAQAPGTTRIGQNVVVYEPTTDRARGGSRPMLGRYVLGQLPSGSSLIQHLNYIVDPQNDALLANDTFDQTTAPVADPSTNAPGSNPADTTDYRVRNRDRYVRSGGSGVQVNRNEKRLPIITWANPDDISVGTALSGTQLNATANVAGSFEYDPPSATVLSEGDNQPLDTLFTPTDTTNYKRTSKTVEIDVLRLRLVQQATDADSEGVPGTLSTSTSLSAQVTAGNLIVFIAAVSDEGGLSGATTITIPTPTDGSGNTYTLIDSATSNEAAVDNSGIKIVMYYAVAVATASVTIACTSTNSQGYGATMRTLALEYTGTHASTPVDDSSSNFSNTNTTTYSTGSISTAFPKGLMIGAFRCGHYDLIDLGVTATAGFTKLFPATSSFTFTVYHKIGSLSATNISLTIQAGDSSTFAAVGASFAPATS